jgi:methylthioribose-1-phosphate isomerase
MARGKKTSPEVIYQVMTSWSITDNLRETARELNMPVSSVKQIVDDNKDKEEFARLRTQKREEFADKATRIIDLALSRLEKAIGNDEEYIPVNQLTTAIGTLYDKRALAKGESTNNTKIVIELPEGVDEYAE